MKGLIVLAVLVIFAMAILPSVQPMMQTQATRAAEDARRAVLDNDAAEQTIKERVIAAAGQANATATGVALKAQATQTAVAMLAIQTAVAFTQTNEAYAYSKRATATAEPYNANIAATTASTTQARDWLSVAFIAVGVFASFAFARAGSGWVSTRGKQMTRDRATGLAQPALIDGRIVDPSRQIGDVRHVRTGPVWKIYRAAHLMLTGKFLPDPTPQAYGPGSDAIAPQLLSATLSTNAVSATRAMFGGKASTDEKEKRIKLMEQGKPQIPQVHNLVEPGDSPTLKLIASALADKLHAEGHDVSTIIDGDSKEVK